MMNKEIKDIKRRAGITEASDHSREIQELMHQLAGVIAKDARNMNPNELEHYLQTMGDNLGQLVHQKMGI